MSFEEKASKAEMVGARTASQFLLSTRGSIWV